MVQSRSTTDAPENVDPVLLDFLREKINSFVKWDLIRFFHDNPHAMDTAENIAQYTGRDVRIVEGELVGLANASILRLHQSSGQKVFSLSSDPLVREMVERFVRACDDRDFRVMAIHQVIQNMH